MRKILLPFIALFGTLLTPSVEAQSTPTVRVPLCLQFPDSLKYVPCTGIVPVDPVTGNTLSWGDALKGSPTNPSSTQETTRRQHWTELTTPLAATLSFNGATRDDGGSNNGALSKWSTFSCFVFTDQVGTLNLQSSDDGTNWISVQTRQTVASVGTFLVQPLFSKYLRCSYTNGANAQNVFVLKSAFGLN